MTEVTGAFRVSAKRPLKRNIVSRSRYHINCSNIGNISKSFIAKVTNHRNVGNQ